MFKKQQNLKFAHMGIYELITYCLPTGLIEYIYKYIHIYKYIYIILSSLQQEAPKFI